eukprot:COSAG01_NODE_7459_length_3203_cov_14.089562_2_plen_151_part_00
MVRLRGGVQGGNPGGLVCKHERAVVLVASVAGRGKLSGSAAVAKVECVPHWLGSHGAAAAAAAAGICSVGRHSTAHECMWVRVRAWCWRAWGQRQCPTSLDAPTTARIRALAAAFFRFQKAAAVGTGGGARELLTVPAAAGCMVDPDRAA